MDTFNLRTLKASYIHLSHLDRVTERILRSLSGVAIELVFGITVVKFLEEKDQDRDDDDNYEDGDDGYSDLNHCDCGGQDGNLWMDIGVNACDFS